MFNIKSQKKTIAFAIVFAIVFLLIICAGFPSLNGVNKINAFGGPVDYVGEDGDGEGTREKPLLIGSFETLNTTFRDMATMPNRHYVLIDNINLNSVEWQPISSLGEGSVLNGNGYTLSNLRITSSSVTVKGFFGTLNGSVKNLYFENVNIQNGTHLGVLAGVCEGRLVEIDNVRVESGTISTTSTNQSMAGGLVGRLYGSGMSDENRANFSISNSYVKNTSSIRAYNGAAGFIGFIQSGNINITIKNSFHEGNLNAISVYAGGMIGGVSNTKNKTIIIENCYAKGDYNAATNYVGGMVGYFNAQPLSTPELYINNCFSQITTSTSYSATKGGIFGQAVNGSGAVFINNCVAVTGSGITKLSGNNAVLDASQMINATVLNTQAMADKLNAGANPPNFVIYENRLELRTFDPRIMFVFNSNGGSFSDQETVKVYDLFKGDDFSADEPNEPQRIGYNFSGWNTSQDGSGVNYLSSEKIDTSDNLTLYANWQIISYVVQAAGNIENQTVTFHKENKDPIYSLTLNQKGYISTRLFSEDEQGLITFNSFLVLKKDAYEEDTPLADYDQEDWVNIGSGYAVTGAGVDELFREQRLDLFDTETDFYLIDENFIENYAIETDDGSKFIFRPVYYEQTIISFSFNAEKNVQKSYGLVYIDGVYNPFGAKLNYIESAGPINIEMKIVVNKYRTLASVALKDGEMFDIDEFDKIDNVYTFTFVLEDGMEFIIEFGSVEFDMSVIAEIKDGDVLDASLKLITDYDAQKVYLNLPFKDVKAQAIDGYRLINNMSNNIKIKNQLTNKYDYFSAIGGEISFSSNDINANFFDKYVDYSTNPDGEIVVVVEYIKQFILQLDIEYLQESYGEVTIQITNLQGNTIILSPSMLGYFDKGSIVKITLSPDEISLIERISNVDITELNEEGNIVQFVLNKNRDDIEIVFGVIEYTLNVKMVNTSLDEIEEIEKIIELDNDRLYAEDEIKLISKGVHPNYEFLGWFAVVGGNLYKLPPPYDQTIERLVLSQSFIESFADDLEINIVGQFVRLFEVNIILPTQNAGSVEFVVLNEDDGGKHVSDNVYREGTLLKIIARPFDYFKLGDVLGLGVEDSVDGNDITIKVNLTIFITLPFIPIEYEIVQNNNLKDAKGDVIISDTKMGIGEQLTLTFKPDSGYEIRSWKINGVDINNLENAVISGNSVVLTITEEWLQIFEEGRMDFEIKTMMNKTYLTILLGGGISIPVLLILVALVVFLNARRKAELQKLVEARQTSERRFASVDFIKDLKNDNKEN